jgi:tetratricopeptide (TPR) repeat protein
MRFWGTASARLAAAACALALVGASAPDPAPPAAIAALGLDPAQARLWSEGLALETRESFAASNQRYEVLAAAHPDSVFLAWRVARNHWRYGEHLAPEAKEERRAAFTQSLEWAKRALAKDPNCGECVFWTMVSMARLATTNGAVASARMAAPMAELIDRGIALQPTSRDNDWNTTLGNLYFAAAAFYRVVPDWPGVTLLIGVRGDKDRALDYIERAIAISPMRVDYHLERGVVLTCIGTERGDESALERGRRELASARAMTHHLGTDAVDQHNAEILLQQPELACGYQRDGFLDLSGCARPRAAPRAARRPRSPSSSSARERRSDRARPVTGAREPRSGRRAAVLLALVSTLLTLALLEGAARVYLHLRPAAPGQQDWDSDALAPPPAPPGAFRIFLYGGSTVAGTPLVEYSFARQLEFWLHRLAPARAFQVVNYGAPGKPTEFAKLELARTIDARPDLVIVHSLHNEFLGWRPPSASRRFRSELRRWLDATATARALRRVFGAVEEARRGGETSLLLPARITPVDPTGEPFAKRVDGFERATREIAAIARAHGVPLILVTDSGNLADWPPAWRFVRDEAYERGVADVRAQIDARQLAPAKTALAALAAQYPGDAMVTWLEGRLAMARGDAPHARAAFDAARDTDPMPWRVLGRFDEVLRALARAGDARIAEFDGALRREARDGLVGFRWIADNCHPTPLGNALLAREILRVMADAKLGISSLRGLPPLAEQADVYVREAQRARPDLELAYLEANAVYTMKWPFHEFAAARDYLERARALAPRRLERVGEPRDGLAARRSRRGGRRRDGARRGAARDAARSERPRHDAVPARGSGDPLGRARALCARALGRASHLRDEVGEREAGGEAGAFDPVQLHEPRDPVLRGPVDGEVAPRLARRDQLGPDPGIARLERALGQTGPEAPRELVERRHARGIDRVVDPVHVLRIGAELHAACEVERRVHRQTAVLGRVDRVPERRAAREGEVAALHEVESRHARGVVALDLLREVVRAEAGGVDQTPAAHLFVALAADAHGESARGRGRALHGRLIGDVGAVLLGVAEQRAHELLGVDDPGVGRERRRDARDPRARAASPPAPRAVPARRRR